MDTTKKRKKEIKFDFRWLGVGIALIAILILGIIANANKDSENVDKISNSIMTDNGDQKINWEKYPTYNIELGESMTLTKVGTYHLTGALNEGSITVNAKNSAVRLILDNVTIKSSDGPAIFGLECDDLVINLVGDNYIEDSANFSSFSEDDGGTIYSKSDLTFESDGGYLDIVSNYADAIVGKDDLKFNGGIYTIDAKDDAIRGTDSVYIMNGTFNLTSVADAIKTTNELDAGKGFVLIEKGNYNITAGAKGIKATSSVLIQDGSFSINAYDDAIHSDNYVGLVNGHYTIDAGDDGIHANKELIIDGGNIIVAKSYEGFEAQAVTINAGIVKIYSSDDGINAGGGADNSTTNNPRSSHDDAFKADIDSVLSINGGDVYINAAGDGLDSNGNLYFNGGNVVVDGPTNNGNGALDSGAGIKMQDGTVIAVGAAGMAETLGSNSGVPNISVYFASTQAAGTKIAIKDSSGKAVLSHESAKTFNHLAAGSSSLILGETYTIFINDDEYEHFTITEVTTTIGNPEMNQFNMPGRGPRV